MLGMHSELVRLLSHYRDFSDISRNAYVTLIYRDYFAVDVTLSCTDMYGTH